MRPSISQGAIFLATVIIGTITWLAVLHTLVIVPLKDEERWREYPTKRLLVEQYEASEGELD